MAITILVCDGLTPAGDPVAGWTDLDVTLRFNEVSTGLFTAPATPALMSQLGTGHRIVVIRDGAVFMAGPWEDLDFTRGIEGDTSPPGRVTVHFADDLALIAGRTTYPDPAKTAADTTQPAYWTTATTAAGTIMLNLVDDNAGPGALTARQVPDLDVGAGTGLGNTVASWRTRWQPLADELRTLAVLGGGLGFRTVQGATSVDFEVYDPDDLTGDVRFSWGLGNLRSVSYSRRAPRLTAAIVGGQGEGADRVIRERTNAGAITNWWRIEQFLDQRQSSDTGELDDAGDEALEDGAETARLQTVTIDTATQRYGVHYRLGDQVSVEPLPGFEVADIVRSVHLQATPESGEVLTALVGSQEASPEPRWIRQMRALDRRLGRLEAT